MSARSRVQPWWLDGADRPSIASVTTESMERGRRANRERFKRLLTEMREPRLTNADPARVSFAYFS